MKIIHYLNMVLVGSLLLVTAACGQNSDDFLQNGIHSDSIREDYSKEAPDL